MDRLPSALRRELEKAVVLAHTAALIGAVSALRRRAVDAAEPFDHFTDTDKLLRRKLRSRARNVGDAKRPDSTHTIDRLAEELAYEYWHRMLFARFLADNGLLMHPDGVPVSLEECGELATTADPPAANGYVLAARYASRMLPQIFRAGEDVLLDIEFAPEHRLALEQILAGMSPDIFRASESLGWSYQFWQSQRKDQINASGVKIDGSTVAPVTQLFTENYMVDFLLHNTIGAWWVSRHPGEEPPVEFEFLRVTDDGTPAAGAFPGWPKTLREFTLLDPCCGSYHFLVTAFRLLVPLRKAEENLTLVEAVDAVLRDNLHGMDIDPCCAKMAVFSLAFVAWTMRDESGEMLGHRPLPLLNVASSGQPLEEVDRKEWLKFANGDADLRAQIDELFTTFAPCYHVGSLIDPTRDSGTLFCQKNPEFVRKLTRQLAKYQHDPEAAAIGVAAQGLAKAAELLSGKYTLVATNVPYLGRGKQGDEIKSYLDEHYSLGKADLATAFVLRCLELCEPGGSTALVTPQNWLFLTSYKKFREELLKKRQFHFMVSLGEEAWQSFGNRGPRTVLFALTTSVPSESNTFFGIDVSTNRGEPIIPLEEKADRLGNHTPTPLLMVRQTDQLENPDARIVLGRGGSGPKRLLEDYVSSIEGLTTGDGERFVLKFWEPATTNGKWDRFIQNVTDTTHFGGRSDLLFWENGCGSLKEDGQAHNFPAKMMNGREILGKSGIRVTQMGTFAATIYQGEIFGKNAATIVPHDVSDLPAIWCFISSNGYCELVRQIDMALKVTNATLAKVPFDLAHWQAVAAEKYPNGLPEPHSDDPTQWLFKGDVATSTDPLQVGVARLLGYRWPDQPNEPDAVDALADDDGIICLPGVRGERPAAERVLELLRTAYGPKWSEAVLHDLLSAAGGKSGATLADWLRDQFFEAHCKRFHQRPFIWHIWDGRKDGFAALVNYHTLTHANLERLAFDYLNEWITNQDADAKAGKAGAAERLGAAKQLQEKLKLILGGESPFDIFVRWKPLHEQPIGWNPDLNDGVWQNIRPFLKAEVLFKWKPLLKILKAKDRGNEPKRAKTDFPWFWDGDTFTGDRVNDKHYTNDQKQAARQAAAVNARK